MEKYIELIMNHLVSMKEDTTLQERLKQHQGKEKEMFAYIQKNARAQAQNGCAMIEENQVYAWAREFYIDYDIVNSKEVQIEKVKAQAEAVAKEEKKKQIETLMNTKKGVDKKPEPKKETKQISLFDFDI